MQAKFISYVRVSTQRQGQSGLGLDAQRIAVANYTRGRGEVVAEAPWKWNLVARVPRGAQSLCVRWPSASASAPPL